MLRLMYDSNPKPFVIDTNILGDEVKIVVDSENKNDAVYAIMSALLEFAEEHGCMEYFSNKCLLFANGNYKE